jgi:hypothetical protein
MISTFTKTISGCVLVFYFQTDVKNVADFLSVGQQVVGNGRGETSLIIII